MEKFQGFLGSKKGKRMSPFWTKNILQGSGQDFLKLIFLLQYLEKEIFFKQMSEDRAKKVKQFISKNIKKGKTLFDILGSPELHGIPQDVILSLTREHVSREINKSIALKQLSFILWLPFLLPPLFHDVEALSFVFFIFALSLLLFFKGKFSLERYIQFQFGFLLFPSPSSFWDPIGDMIHSDLFTRDKMVEFWD